MFERGLRKIDDHENDKSYPVNPGINLIALLNNQTPKTAAEENNEQST